MDLALQQAIDAHPVITFDVYDTLLRRIVFKDRDLWKLVDQEWEKRFGAKSFNFYAERSKADKIARKAYDYSEVNIDEIYEHLSNLIGEDNAKRCKTLELDFEHTLVTPNKPIVDAFYYALSKGKDVYIISDMYLRHTDVESALHNIGVKGYKKLFVSCEYRATKHESGELYKIVSQDINVDVTNILHIGNDKNADVNKASIVGADTYWVREQSNTHYIDEKKSDISLDFSLLNGFISKYSKEEDNLAYKLGFEVFGPIISGFLYWIGQHKIKEKLDKVIFLARDGYILEDICKENHILGDTEYFYLSRRSMVVPMIQYQESLEDILNLYKSWPTKSSATILFDKLGLENNFNLLYQFGISESEEFTKKELIQDSRIVKLFESVKHIVYENSINESNLLKQYIESLGSNVRIGIVDLGSGTIYNSLVEFTKYHNIDIEWIPLYFQNTQCPNHSYMDISNNLDLKSALRFGYLFLEIFFTAPHGTTMGYISKLNKVQPVLSKYEYDTCPDKYKNRLSDLHSGAKDFYNVFPHQLIDETSSLVIFSNLEAFLLHPSNLDIEYWGEFPFFENYYIYNPMIKNRNIVEYIKNPKLLVSDIQSSLWLSGFLRKLIGNNLGIEIISKIYRIKAKYMQ